MKRWLTPLLFFACVFVATSAQDSQAESVIAKLNAAVGHEDWKAAAALFSPDADIASKTEHSRPSAETLRVIFHGTAYWDELGPAHFRIVGTRRIGDNTILIEGLLTQIGSLSRRADPVVIGIRRDERGWRITSLRPAP